MGNVLAEVASAKTYRNLLEFTTTLAEQMAKSQGAASCHVKAEGVYTFVELVKGWKPAKDKQSIEAIPLLAETFCSETSPRIKSAGFRVSHMTACPCVQGALQTLLRLKNATTQVPLFTHSQRCETEILLHDVKQYFDLVKVLALVDECTTRTQNTLPREHELALVYSSHKKPSFLEDVVRCCATEFYRTFSALFNPGGLVKVSSTSMESIHSFDLHAEGKYPDGPAGVSQGTQNSAT
jgi:GTP cyclohydrolase-4